jgi:hypothetical protein
MVIVPRIMPAVTMIVSASWPGFVPAIHVFVTTTSWIASPNLQQEMS